MSSKMEFLIKAIEEVQETNRFLDTKAGVLLVFESSLLVVAVSGLIDAFKLQQIQTLINRVAIGYLTLLAAYFIGYLIALVVHILITLRVIFPKENPEDHVELGDYQPRGLFFLHKLDQNQRIKPSLSEYFAQWAAMSDDDIAKEYVFEQSKLSYIRKKKSDGLALSFRFLGVMIIGIAIFGLLFVLGGLIY